MTSLKAYNTFGIDANADELIVIHTLDELTALLASRRLLNTPHIVIGGGSNMVFTQDYHGVVVHLANKGIHLVQEEGDDLIVEAAAGEVWDTFVRTCVANGWHGAENLVAIPGTVGASPVQNVGAYGREAKDIIHSVIAYNIATGEQRVFTNKECQFAYRSSVFKTELAEQYIVASVRYRLSRSFKPYTAYAALSSALAAEGVAAPTAAQLINLIARIRDSKLPNPKEIGSAGSFFKNPIVGRDCYERIAAAYPDLVAYPVGKQYKLAAGWLIERAGWKGKSIGRAGVYEKQALVLVNRGGATGEEVKHLAHTIMANIQQQFGVTLECEAIII